MERYLAIGPRSWKFTSWRGARPEGHEGACLPPALGRVIAHLGNHVDFVESLEAEIDASLADELWNQACEVAVTMARDVPALAHLSSPETLDAWQTVELLSVALAEGMSYPRLRLWALAQDDEPWAAPPTLATRLLGPRRLRSLARRLEGIELFLVSAVQMAPVDLRSLRWLVAQPFQRGLVGMCRHYSKMLQVLFYAAKRSTGRFQHAHIIRVGGYATFRSLVGHSWNWFVDDRSDRIVALDLTGADWLLDGRRAETVLNRGFDGSRWNNMSAFLADLMEVYRQWAPASIHDDIEELFPQLIEQATERGQVLLLRLACQTGLHREVSKRIAAFLDQQGFNRWFLGWRIMIRATEASLDGALGRLGSDRERQHSLLDRIGLPR